MREKVIIIGGGGHAHSVIDIGLGMEEYEIAGIIDSGRTKEVMGFPVIGADADLAAIYRSGITHAFVALGDNAIRHRIYEEIKEIGYELVNFVSRHAYIAPSVRLGKGICIMPGAVVSVHSIIGDNTIINTNCSIDHDSVIGKSCHIAPGVSMSGKVTIGDGTHIGTGAAVIDGINIGSWSYIGAGAAVVADMPDGIMAYGVPAKTVRNL